MRVKRSLVGRLLRAAAAALAVAAYALPLAFSVVTNVVHDVYHLREHLEHRSMEVADFHEPQPDDFVHAHGGTEHSHDETTDALLGAADRTHDPTEEPHAPALELVGHLPAQLVVVELLGPEGGAWAIEPDLALSTSPTPPPIPPPRV